MSPLVEAVVLGHRGLGYATAFLIAPAALLAFDHPATHRRWGKTYVVVMTILYLGGTGVGFVRHPVGSYELWRNLAFNFFGFYFVLYGWRAVTRWRRARHAAAPLDLTMWAVLAGVSAALLGLGLRGHFPSSVFGVLGLALAAHEWPELKRGSGARRLYVRHLRCMYASYLYVLTVLTLVHFRGLPTDLRWLWPTLFGIPALVYATGGGVDRRRLRRAVGGTLAVSVVAAVAVVATSVGVG